MDIKNTYFKYNTLIWAGLLLAQICFFYFISKSQKLLSFHIYFFEWQKAVHQKIFSWIPFSIGDVFYIILGVYILGIFIKSFKNRKKSFKQICILLNICYLTYQLIWGLLYFQPPIIEKLPEGKSNLNDIKRLTEIYFNKCIADRALIHENHAGVFKIKNIDSIKKEILNSQKSIPKKLINLSTTEVKSIKPSLFADFMSYTGILGYYNPFTAEAQFNNNIPDTQIPFTLSHESAHQLGIAREEEANFAAFLMGKNSQNNELRYSTHYFVLKNLLIHLQNYDPEYVKKMVSEFPVGLEKDFMEEKAFYKKHEGLLNTVFYITNDWFLKSNQQDGSISYSYFIELFIRYETKELRFTTQFQKHK
ncbi:DUF3810 domain-containing protein [Amniculibacterium sp. G2-70]|uniref:DUF3810 domain-containing protein n=1 Tax=Amniculibacterium sp. G2-70 TaxID=2767188 RepID=UPI001654439A|nr:DUF3810 domain-containing protein [Amniculibacterium sp. G2-70]